MPRALHEGFWLSLEKNKAPLLVVIFFSSLFLCPQLDQLLLAILILLFRDDAIFVGLLEVLQFLP